MAQRVVMGEAEAVEGAGGRGVVGEGGGEGGGGSVWMRRKLRLGRRSRWVFCRVWCVCVCVCCVCVSHIMIIKITSSLKEPVGVRVCVVVCLCGVNVAFAPWLRCTHVL